MTDIDTFRSDLLAAIATFCEARGMSETAFGKCAVNDGKFVPRLRSGANMTTESLRKARDFILKNGTEEAAE